MQKWIKRNLLLNSYTHLVGLGFFQTKVCSKNKKLVFMNVLFLQNNLFYWYDFKTILLSIYQLIPLIKRWTSLKYIFTFIDFSNLCLSFLELTLDLLKTSYSYIIYDWSYGIISNFRAIRLKTFSYASTALPNIAFLLHMYKRENLVSIELKNRLVLTVGLVPHTLSSLVDYPLSMHTKPESTLIFLKLLLYNMNLELSSIKKANRFSNINWKIELPFEKQESSKFKSEDLKVYKYKALHYGQNLFKAKKKYVFWTTELGKPIYRK